MNWRTEMSNLAKLYFYNVKCEATSKPGTIGQIFYNALTRFYAMRLIGNYN